MRGATIDRLKVLSDARAAYAGIQRELRKDKCPPAMGEMWGASFSVGGFDADGASANVNDVVMDIETARLVWPLIRKVIEAEYRRLGGT